MSGYWWVHGYGFMGMRVNEKTGAATFGAFDVPDVPVQAESLISFINASAAGNFIALSVIFDGQTNVTPALKSALKALGSAYIDSLLPGYAWSMIARKGAGGAALSEHWSATGVTQDSVMVANYYSLGSGTITSAPLPMPQKWDSFRWSGSSPSGSTFRRAAILGVKSTGSTDTLLTIPQDSVVVHLQGLTAVTSDPSYVAFRATSVLTSQDVLVTPVLREWSADFEPPADLAISSRTIAPFSVIVVPKTAEGIVGLRVFNIGYRTSDSARVVLSIVDPNGTRRPVAYAMCDSIPPGGYTSLTLPFAIGGLPRQFTVEARVTPAANAKDLVQENNIASCIYQIQGNADKLSAQIRVFADGLPVMDGDYVAANPRFVVQLNNVVNPGTTPPQVDLLVDNVIAPTARKLVAATTPSAPAVPEGELWFAPSLPNGTHDVKVRVSQVNAVGGIDTVIQHLTVNVTDQYAIKQVYNYPNPFSRDTWFTFMLTGARPADALTIRIFTVAGRLIREVEMPPGTAQIGYNRVYWDGRDADGDEIANGYYFFRVLLKGGDKTESALGKLAKVR
jgi:hypothetical protein